MYFFGNLVPALALPDSGAQFPAATLGNFVQFRTQSAQAVRHSLRRLEPWESKGKALGTLGDDSNRTPKPPVGSAERGDVLAVDTNVVLGQLMVGEDRAEV